MKPLEEGWFLVEAGERRFRIAVANEPHATWVFVDGQVARIEHEVQGARAGRRRTAGSSDVMSPMPATVVAMHATPGQSVTEGETLIVLEAMKMELPIKAPRSGVVKAIHCAQGDLVQPGVILIEFT
jgi:biotin carboxyl carrier protein